MAADVKCAICGQKASTANIGTDLLGYCKRCSIYWHERCHNTKQCPHCKHYTM